MNPAILIVEDDSEMRAALRDVLNNEGHRVLTACNGAEALGLVDREIPAVIITDLRMPVMNGWSLITSIRRRPELRRVPVLVFSADTGSAESLPRIVSVFAKPAGLERLLASVRTIVGSTVGTPRRSTDRTRPARCASDDAQTHRRAS